MTNLIISQKIGFKRGEIKCKVPPISGIYFLYLPDNDLLYIGQSENLMERLMALTSDRKFIKYNITYCQFLPVEKEKRSEYECYFKQKLLPLWEIHKNAKCTNRIRLPQPPMR